MTFNRITLLLLVEDLLILFFPLGDRYNRRVVAVRRRRADDAAAVHHLAAVGVGALQAARLRARQPPPRDGAGGAEVRLEIV